MGLDQEITVEVILKEEVDGVTEYKEVVENMRKNYYFSENYFSVKEDFELDEEDDELTLEMIEDMLFNVQDKCDEDSDEESDDEEEESEKEETERVLMMMLEVADELKANPKVSSYKFIYSYW